MTISLIFFATLLFGCKKPPDIYTYLTNLFENGKLNGNGLAIQNDIVFYEHSFGYVDGEKKHLLSPTIALLQVLSKKKCPLPFKPS